MTLLNDRSQGGTSLASGHLELMLHRRLLDDDSLGVEEPLNEMIEGQGLVVKGQVSMLLDTVEKSASVHRDLAHQIYNKPLVTFSLDNEPSLARLSGFSMLAKPLPPNLHLLTLTPDLPTDVDLSARPTDKTLIVRIEHFYEKDEDAVLSKPVTVNLKEVFGKSFKLADVEELALTGTFAARELDERMRWRGDDTSHMVNDMFEYKTRRESSSSGGDEKFLFTFNPMQIRTFRLYLTKSN